MPTRKAVWWDNSEAKRRWRIDSDLRFLGIELCLHHCISGLTHRTEDQIKRRQKKTENSLRLLYIAQTDQTIKTHNITGYIFQKFSFKWWHWKIIFSSKKNCTNHSFSWKMKQIHSRCSDFIHLDSSERSYQHHQTLPSLTFSAKHLTGRYQSTVNAPTHLTEIHGCVYCVDANVKIINSIHK